MPAKKKMLISKTSHILFVPSGENRVALNLVEAHLANRYGRGRMEITNAECMSFCIETTVKQWSPVKQRAILREYGDLT